MNQEINVLKETIASLEGELLENNKMSSDNKKLVY